MFDVNLNEVDFRFQTVLFTLPRKVFNRTAAEPFFSSKIRHFSIDFVVTYIT